MKTQQPAQEIFDVLVNELCLVKVWYMYFVDLKLYPSTTDYTINSALTYFSEKVKDTLNTKNINAELNAELSDVFLATVYFTAFRTGKIPENRNHILMNYLLSVRSQKFPVLTFWVDLDQIAYQLNNQLKITPPCRFEITHLAEIDFKHPMTLANDATLEIRSEVNSLKNTSNIDTNFLIGCIVSGVVSVFALLIAALAVASIITLSTAGIFTAVSVGLVAGVASYCFFKARSGVNTTVAPIEETRKLVSSIDIETIFREHFDHNQIKNLAAGEKFQS
jgi:hypothetical protein